MVVEVGKELGRDEEVLTAVGTAGRLDELVMDCTFGALVHTLMKHAVSGEMRGIGTQGRTDLVDLVDERKGSMSLFGHAHEVQDRRQ